MAFDLSTAKPVTGFDVSTAQPLQEVEALTDTGEITNEGRPIFENQFGESVTERTITITDPRINQGQPTNIPTVFNGQFLSDEDAILSVANAQGNDPITGMALQGFGSIDEAVENAKSRSAGLLSPSPGIEFLESVPGFLGEVVAAANRSIAGALDFFGPDTVQAAFNIAGIDVKVPTLTEAITVPPGTFLGEGLGTEIAGGIGELAAIGAGTGALLRKGVSMLPAAVPGEATGLAVARQAAATTPAADIGFGAVAGAGQEVGREVGGEAGALAGSILAPVGIPVAARALAASAGRAAREGAEQLGTRAQALRQEIDRPAVQEIEDITQTIARAKPDEVQALVNADPATLKAIDDLQIAEEPIASFVSQNPQFVDVEQALSSIPGATLAKDAENFIKATSQKADDLIVEFGGDIDKAIVSDRFRQESLKTIDDLGKQADDLYDRLRDIIPGSTEVQAPNTISFLEQKIKEFGGIEFLPPKLKRLFAQLKTTEKTGKSPGIDVVTGQPKPGKVTTKGPTYGRLNFAREEIGQAIHSRSGAFKDQESGLNRALYKRLRLDQDAIASANNAADVSDAANALLRQRKSLEKNLSDLIGKDLDGAVVSKVSRSLGQLAKGDFQKFDAVMKRIPDKAIRQDIIVTSLNDIFRGSGARAQSFNPTQFAKFMDDLERSPAAKDRLFRQLPPGARVGLENLAIVARGISAAQGRKIPTGRVLSLFDETGMLQKLMGTGLSFAAGKAFSPAAGFTVREFLNQTSGGARSAAEMLGSKQFQALIRQAVAQGTVDSGVLNRALQRQEQAFARSAVFKKWAESIDDQGKQVVARVGLIKYLFDQDTEEQQP